MDRELGGSRGDLGGGRWSWSLPCFHLNLATDHKGGSGGGLPTANNAMERRDNAV